MKPGDRVVITRVPQIAEEKGICVGMQSVVEPSPTNAEQEAHGWDEEELGLMRISFETGWTFWWAKDDLELIQ